MKVIFIHPDLGIGGAERLVLDVAIALKEHGLKTKFVTNHFDVNHAFDELKNGEFCIEVFGSWIPRHFLGGFRALFAYIRMFYLILTYVIFISRRDKPDVFFVDQIPVANIILKLCGFKVIYYCHHPDLLSSPHTGFIKNFYRVPLDFIEEYGTCLSDVILVNSKYTARILYETFPKIRQDINILYPTVPPLFFNKLKQNNCQLKKIDSRLIRNSDSCIFLSINRFHPTKELSLAIRALDCLRSSISEEKFQKIYLVLAGGYDSDCRINHSCYSELKHLCREMNLGNNILFLKSPSDNMKADLLNLCDCVIYTPKNEHFGIVPLEAMAAGKPVIAANCGGPCETIIHESSGFLVNHEPLCFGECMQKILCETTATNMGNNGKKYLEINFSFETFTKQIIYVVDKLLHLETQGSVNCKPFVVRRLDILNIN